MALAIPIEMTTPLKPDGRTFDAVSSAGTAATDSDAGETMLWTVLATVAEVLILGTMSFLITHEAKTTNDFRTTAPGGHAMEVPFFLALWGELFFGLSGFGIVGPHFLSACNVGRLQNEMDDHETNMDRRLRDVSPEAQIANSVLDNHKCSEESSVEVEDVRPMSRPSTICFSGTMSNSAAACFSSPSELDAVIKNLQVARPLHDTTKEALFTSPFLWRVVAVVAEIWILGAALVFLLRGSDTMEVPFFLAVWGELFFGLSGFGIVGPHFLSACNIGGMQNDMHGMELVCQHGHTYQCDAQGLTGSGLTSSVSQAA